VSLLELERKEMAAQRGILEHTTNTAQADRSHSFSPRIMNSTFSPLFTPPAQHRQTGHILFHQGSWIVLFHPFSCALESEAA
jgi:hypothetical protein